MTIEKYISKNGKECFRGLSENTKFDLGMFRDVAMQDPYDNQAAIHSDIGSITVLDRMTGFGWRDTETGFRDNDNNFWLASGGYDVRDSGVKTFGEAIEWIKSRANTCVGA